MGTHLSDHHHHQENTNHQIKRTSTMNLMENRDQSEEDERIKRSDRIIINCQIRNSIYNEKTIK